MAEKDGGYDLNFIEEPPDELLCLICMFPARDPLQNDCCGKVFCSTCITKYREKKEECPNCRDRKGNQFKDRRGERNIKALRVRCEYKDNGCDWTGKVGVAESHISQCIYCMIVCPNMCKGRDGKEIKILQKDLQTHLDNECQCRQFPCPHCKEEGEYQYITGSHKETCQYIKVNCSNEGCRESVRRMDLNKHKLTCPHEKINCKFELLGCKTVLCRQEMEEHEINSQTHLTMAMDEVIKLNKKLEQATIPRDGKITFLFPSFNQHKTSNKTFYSSPFYTHKGGYKMCIRVDANGNGEGKGSHISVFANLMKGDYDDNLKWPIRGKVIIMLLNQLEDDYHHTCNINYPKRKDDESTRRVVNGTREKNGFGRKKFIAHEELVNESNCQYLKDDCLYFRVSADTPSPNPKPWLHC